MEENRLHKDNDINVLAGEFIDSLILGKHSPQSVRSYGLSVTGFAQYVSEKGKRNVTEITPQDLTDFQQMLLERGYQQNSLYTYLRVVRAFFRYLHENGHVFVNPAADMRMPGPARKMPSVPTEDEIRILLAKPDTSMPIGIRDRAILETLYSTAIRNEETIMLDVKSVDMTSATIRVKERILPVGKDALNWIRLYLCQVRDGLLNGNREEPALWLNTMGKRLSGQQLDIFIKCYAQACNEIKTHITVDAMRRACAAHMLKHGASSQEMQSLFGRMKHFRDYLRGSITASEKGTHGRDSIR